MSNIAKCISKYKSASPSDAVVFETAFKQFKESMSEMEAANSAMFAVHKLLHGELNDVYTQAGLKDRVKEYVAPEVEKVVEPAPAEKAEKPVKAAKKTTKKTTKKKTDVSFSRPDAEPLVYVPPYTVTALTKLSNFQGREIKVDTIRQTLKQGSTKAIERDVIESVLARPEFADANTVSFDAFRSAVAAAIIPLRTMRSTSYADYGASSVGVNADEMVTNLYNTNLEHGRMGHFPSEFNKDTVWEMKAVTDPATGNTYYAATEEGANLTEENLMQHVGTFSENAARVEEWINSRANEEGVSGQNKGLFGHDRTWRKGQQSFVAEMQSDVFQKQKAAALLLDSYKAQLQQKSLSSNDPLYPIVNKIVALEERIGRAGRDVVRAYKNTKDQAEAQEELVKRQNKVSELQGMIDDGIPQALASARQSLYGQTAVPSYSEILTKFLETHFADNPAAGRAIVSGPMNDLLYEASSEARLHHATFLGSFKSALDEAKKQADKAQEFIDAHNKIANSPAYKQYAEQRAALSGLHKEFDKNLSLTDKQFIAHRKNYTLRMVREAIRREALAGQTELLIPAPLTLAKIEGYVSGAPQAVDNGLYTVEEANDEDELEQGDEINVGGTTYTVVEVDGDEIIVSDSVTEHTYEEYARNEQEHEYDNAMYELRDMDGDILTAEEIIEQAQELAYVYFDGSVVDRLEEADFDDAEQLAEFREKVRPDIEKQVDGAPYRELAGGYEVTRDGIDFRGLTLNGAYKQVADYLIDRKLDEPHYIFDADSVSGEVQESIWNSGREYGDEFAEDMQNFSYAWEIGNGDWMASDGSANIIRFLQPYALAEQAELAAEEAENESEPVIEEQPDKINPITQKLSDTQQTIVDKYIELMDWFTTERGDVKIVKDSSGAQWLSTKLLDKDKGDIVAFERQSARYAKENRAAMRHLSESENTPLPRLALDQEARSENRILRFNAQGNRLLTEAMNRGLETDSGDWFGGYMNTDQVESVREGLTEIGSELNGTAKRRFDSFVKTFNSAVDSGYGDLIFFTDLPMSPTIVKNGIQEEMSHRADFRARDNQELNLSTFDDVKGYDKAIATVKKSYPTASKRTLHNEVIAKLFRNDANKVLGITENERLDIEDAYRTQLLDAGISPKEVAFAFANVSQSSERFANETYSPPNKITRTRRNDAPRTDETPSARTGDSASVRGESRSQGIDSNEKRKGRTPQVRQAGLSKQTDASVIPAPLFKKQTAESRELQKKLRNADVETLGEGAEFAIIDGNLEVNEESAELINRAIAANSPKSSQSDFLGLFMTPKYVAQISGSLSYLAKSLKKNGWSAKSVANVEKLAKSIRSVAKAGWGDAIVYVYEEAIPHEQRHQMEYWAKPSEANDATIIKTDLFQYAMTTPFADHYGKLSRQHQVMEFIAELENGGGKRFGWDKAPDYATQKARIMRDRAVSIVDNNLDLAAEMGADAFNNKFREVIKYAEEIEPQNTQSDTGRTEDVQSPQEDGPGAIRQRSSPGTETARDSEQAEEGTGVREDGSAAAPEGKLVDKRPGKSGLPFDEQKAQEAKEKGQKVAAFSRILGQEYYYDPQEHAATAEAAQQLLTNKSVSQVIEDVLDNTRPSAASMQIVYWELNRLNSELRHFTDEGLTNEAEAVSVTIANLASKIIVRQVANGQETEIAKTIEPLSVEAAILTATRLKQYASGDVGAQLTADQTQIVNNLATELMTAKTELQKIQRLYADAQDTIAGLADNTKPLPPKNRITNARAVLRKRYATERPVVLQNLKKLFPDSVLFTGKQGTPRTSGDGMLKMVALPILPQSAIKPLLDFTVGEIVNDKSYSSIMKTLADLTGLNEDAAELQQIHADANALIKEDVAPAKTLTPEQETQAEERKAIAKIRAEHTRKAKKFEKEKDQTLSVIAQDAQNSDDFNDPNLVHVIDLRTNPKHRSLNNLDALLLQLQKDLGITIVEAERLARSSVPAIKAIKQRRSDARDAQSGISKELRQEMTEAMIIHRKAAGSLSSFLRQMQTPKNLMQRTNNSMRAKWVYNHITQSFNLLQGAIIGGGINGALINPMQLMIQAGSNKLLGKPFGAENASDGRVRDFWRPMAYLFAANAQASEGILANFPTEWERIHTALFGDVTVGDSASTENARNKVTKVLHKALDKDDTINAWLSVFTGAKAQEMHVRYALFRANIDSVLLKRTNGELTSDKLLKIDDDLMNYVTENDIRLAVDSALEGTFAGLMDDQVGKTLKRGYDQIDKILPVIFNPVTFARFTYVTSKVMVLNPFTFGALDTKALGGKGYSAKSIAQGTLAWGGIAMAYGLLTAFGGDDDRWETLFVFGKDEAPINVKRFFPISAYFYAAHLIKNIVEGRPNPTIKEFLEGFASIESDYFQRGAGMEFAGTAFDLMQSKTDSDAMTKSTARLIGNVISGILSVAKPLKPLLAQFDEFTGFEESNFRNYDDTATGQFMEEIAKSLPVVSKLYDAEKMVDAVSGAQIKVPTPISKFAGLTRVPVPFLKPQKTAATEWAEKLFPMNFTGEFTDEKRKIYSIQESFRKAARSQTMTLDNLDIKINELIQQNKLTSEQGKKLKTDMRLTRLQSKIKAGFTIADTDAGQKDMKALRQVWRKASRFEKDDIRKVLETKENRNFFFNSEFDLPPKEKKEKKEHAHRKLRAPR